MTAADYADATAAVLDVRNLGCRVGNRVLFSDLSFRVEPGGCLVLRGPNGAGKTSMLQCLLDQREHSGVVEVNGRVVDESAVWFRRAVATVVGQIQFFDHLTVSEHLDLLARAHGVEAARAEATLDQVGIAHVADQFPGTLSSGETQRLALATALVRPFDLLVLDEPEQRLDVEGRAWLAGLLRELISHDAAVVMASHDPALIEAVATGVFDLDTESA